jgi:hypothetical protein
VQVDPEGIDQAFEIHPRRTAELQTQPGTGGFPSLHDVGGPVAVGPGLLIGVKRGDAGEGAQFRQIAAAEQHGFDPDLGHHHLHAGMGIADGDVAGHLQSLGPAPHAEGAGDQLQGRRGPQAVTKLQPQQREAEQQQQDQQEGGEERQA